MTKQFADAHPLRRESNDPTMDELRARVEEAEGAIRAIRAGEIDALVVAGPEGERVHTVEGSDLAYRHLFEQMSEVAVVLDDEGVILFANGRLGEMLAKPMGKIVGTSLAQHVAQRDLNALDNFLHCGKRGNSQSEINLVKADGTQVPIHASIAEFASGSLKASCLILTDLSTRFCVEAALRLARETAEAANRAKGQFLANMSHEIRTPMNAIVGLTELTLATELDCEQRENLEIVQSATHSLLAIIEDLLDFSKIDAGKLTLEFTEFEPREQLHAALNLLAVMADKKGLDLVCHVHPGVPDTLLGDPCRLRQIIINLVGNGIKFADSGHVLVEVEPESEDAAGIVLRFTVTDTGVGIESKKIGRIFDAFVQADGSTTRTHGGTGLGLAITAALVELMGGRIWVESEVGAGSRFCFTSRLSTVRAFRSMQRPLPHQIRGQRILVVAASALQRRILAEILEGWGLKPVLAANGREALDALERSRNDDPPFLRVLLDAAMSGPDGINVARRIHDKPGLAGRVILLAGLGDRLVPGLPVPNLGGAPILRRPIREAELLAAISAEVDEKPETNRRSESLSGSLGAVRDGRPLRILLVEDQPLNLRATLLMLEKRGHEVVAAINGKTAFELACREPFDLVLMDVQMPEVDGFEATSAIRSAENGTGRHLPIIALTAYAMKEDRDRCLMAGMDEYLAKPIREDELWSTISKCVTTAAPGAALELPR